MSTTSLSSCGTYIHSECDGSKYTCVFEDRYGRRSDLMGPFYNTMGQPLVYYAQVQPKRKGNGNCFMKAFKWYTQDFVKERKRANAVAPDISDFATWLDSKYSEYLQENDAQQISQKSQPQSQSSRPSAIDTKTCPPCQSTAKRRFPRMRSPWSKCKSANKNTGDMPVKSESPNASCQFILQPQELNRPASECCYQTITTCPNKSNTTVILSEARGAKSAVKSRSMTSICSQNITKNCIDVITVQEGATARDIQKSMALCDQNCKAQEIITNVQQSLAKQKHEVPKETRQPLVDSQRMQMTCVQTNLIKQTPFKRIQQAPVEIQIVCDESCRTKQYPQNVDKIQQMPSTSQRINITCDGSCTSGKERKLVSEVRQTPLKSQTHCEENCTTKEECRIFEEMLQSVAGYDSEIPYSKSKQRQLSQGLKPQERPGLDLLGTDTCNKTPVGTQKCRLMENIPNDYLLPISNCPNSQECNIRAETARISSASGLINAPYDQKIVTKQRNVQCMTPVTSEQVELFCEQTCPAKCNNNVVEKAKLPTQKHKTYQQQYKKSVNMRKLSLKELIDNECQCPEEKSADTRSYPHETYEAPSSIDPPCNCIAIEKLPPISVQVQQNRSWLPNGPNGQDKIMRATISPCELSGETRPEPYKTAANKRKVSSNILNTDNECQGPLEEPIDKQAYPRQILLATSSGTDPPCKCIVLERVPIATMQAEQNQRATQLYSQDGSKSAEPSFTKTLQRSMINTSCHCSEKDIMQSSNARPLNTQSQTKSYVSHYQNKVNTAKVNVSCQCSGNHIDQYYSPSIYEQRRRIKSNPLISHFHKETKNIKVDASCQCSAENVLEYNTSCQYKRNDFEPCESTSVCPKLVRLTIPTACNAQRTDSITVNNSVYMRKLIRSSATFRSDGVQTSDHSINLEKKDIQDYAFFMKIVCADKLNDNLRE